MENYTADDDDDDEEDFLDDLAPGDGRGRWEGGGGGGGSSSLAARGRKFLRRISTRSGSNGEEFRGVVGRLVEDGGARGPDKSERGTSLCSPWWKYSKAGRVEGYLLFRVGGKVCSSVVSAAPVLSPSLRFHTLTLPTRSLTRFGVARTHERNTLC